MKNRSEISPAVAACVGMLVAIVSLLNQGCWSWSKTVGEGVAAVNPGNVVAPTVGNQVRTEGPMWVHRNRELDKAIENPDSDYDEVTYPPGHPKRKELEVKTEDEKKESEVKKEETNLKSTGKTRRFFKIRPRPTQNSQRSKPAMKPPASGGHP